MGHKNQLILLIANIQHKIISSIADSIDEIYAPWFYLLENNLHITTDTKPNLPVLQKFTKYPQIAFNKASTSSDPGEYLFCVQNRRVGFCLGLTING